MRKNSIGKKIRVKRQKRAKKETYIPKTGFAAVEQAVEDLLEFQASVVIKVPRAGMTTSLDKVCRRKKKRLCILEPTNKIMDMTLPESENTIRIRANSFCKFNRQLQDKYPVLKNVLLPLPMDCRECSGKNECEVYKPILTTSPDRIALTYPKLEALWLSKGNTALELRNKLYTMDVLFLDEAHTIDQSTKASVPYLEQINVQDKYKTLNRLCQFWRELRNSNHDAFMEMSREGLKNPSSKHFARKIERGTKNETKLEKIPWETIASALSELVDMVKEQGCTDNEVCNIRDMITILGSDEIWLNYISTDQGSSGKVLISAGASLSQEVLAEFISCFRSRQNKTLIITSGTSVEPDLPGGFQSIAGGELRYILFPDFLKSTQTMTLIPTKWKLTSRNFYTELPRMIKHIKEIAKYENKSIYIITPNNNKSKIIKKELAKDTTFWEKYSDSLTVDYYRSDATMGVKRSERICIAIGFAETPKCRFPSL